MTDKIIIKGLRLFAYHGVNPEEKEQGQEFELDITLFADLSAACESDDVENTVSYAKVVKTVSRVFLQKKHDLIESAAEAVAQAVLGEYALVQSVCVRLKKPHAPVSADFDYMAVEITRSR